MKKYTLHQSDTRGFADHGWLKSYHTFSFANYYNAERVHFGVLRVLNDDFVEGGQGFGLHPHENMEIISIPLEGDLEHKDNMGNSTIIKHGDIQVMSAGTGVYHSEFNHNKDKAVKFLQIWIFPNKKNVTPRYDQITLKMEDRINRFQQIVSPNTDDDVVWIHQDAWFHIGKFDKGNSIEYSLKKEENGLYLFVLSGSFEIDNQIISKRDGLGIENGDSISIKSLSDNAELLIMEIPMR